MDNAGYVTLSAQVSLQRQLDIVANNVANLNTVGFKADRAIFSEAVARAGTTTASDGPSFVVDKHSWTDFTAGSLRQTGSDLDVAISGEGFLSVETPEGAAYTRDGRLAISADGTLVNAAGFPVLDADGSRIALRPGTGSLAIARDGTISADGAALARLGVFAGPGAQAFEKLGGGLFKAPDELELLENPSVAQGMLEDSNVSGVMEMTELVNITRAYGHANSLAESVDRLQRDAVGRIGRV